MKKTKETKQWEKIEKEYNEHYPNNGTQTALERIADLISFANSESAEIAAGILQKQITLAEKRAVKEAFGKLREEIDKEIDKVDGKDADEVYCSGQLMELYEIRKLITNKYK